MTKDNEPYITGYDRVEVPEPHPDMTELIEAVAPHLDEALREPVSYEMIGRILSAITDAGYRIVKNEPQEELHSLLSGAYIEGATAVHRFLFDDPEASPDFAEAAGDYATWEIERRAAPGDEK